MGKSKEKEQPLKKNKGIFSNPAEFSLVTSQMLDVFYYMLGNRQRRARNSTGWTQPLSNPSPVFQLANLQRLMGHTGGPHQKILVDGPGSHVGGDGSSP